MTRTTNKAFHDKYSEQAKAMPDITVWFLQASRSIRTVWLLEELGLPYDLKFANRVNQKAPQDFKDASGNPLGKFPTIKDGDLVLFESGAITDYLCGKYDIAHKLLPSNQYLRSRTQIFIHAAEGTLLLHALAILYAQWQFPAALKESNPEALDQMVSALSVNVRKDMDWLQSELEASTGNFLVGNEVTAADIMMHFSVTFTLARELGTKGGSWQKIDEWVKRCEESPAYKKAVEKSGYTLFPEST